MYNNPFNQFNSPSGTMVYELMQIENHPKEEFAFLVKEEQRYINSHKFNPIVQIRAGLIKTQNVWVMPMMVLINNDYDMLYETFFNFYRTNGSDYLNALSRQDFLYIIFYDMNNEQKRQLVVANSLKSDFEEINMRLTNTQPWTMNDFDSAKAKTYEMYPTPQSLWNNLDTIKL